MEMDRIICNDCLEAIREIPDKSVDLVIGSPPYANKGRRYGSEMGLWKTSEWVAWMSDVTREAVRVSRNVVVWVVNGCVRGGVYEPAVELLIAECYATGIRCERPAIWHKNSAPTTRPWFVNDWEYCAAFRPADSSEYFNWEAIATEPKFKSGGKFRQRDGKGKRREGGAYPQTRLTRPRDVIRATVGGGHMGSPLASENEAPFPESLIEPFVLSLCPPGGAVLDPFCGSGTTLAVADRLGRSWLGIEVRESQVELSQRRIVQQRAKDGNRAVRPSSSGHPVES